MMKNWKRAISFLLCVALLLGNFPVVSFAAENDGLCEHHTVHESCGYEEGVSDCGYHCHDCELANQPPATEETKPVCTGLADCTAENHEADCEKAVADAKAAEEEAARKAAEEKAAADQAAADAVAALIAALPTLEAVQAKPLEEQADDYTPVLFAYSAYEQLTEEQKALLPPAEEIFKPYFDYFNSLTQEVAVTSGYCGTNVRWSFNSGTGAMSITGSGEMTASPGSGATTALDWDHNSVKSVTIANGVTSIYEYSFWSNYNLTNVTIGNGVKKIGNGAFGCCDKLTNITLPSGLQEIGYMAFYGSGLTSITFPNNLTTIGQEAFAGTSVTSVNIPAKVTEIGGRAFSGCTELTKFTVHADNPNYSSDSSGALFNKDKTTLYQVPAKLSGAYSIPDGVKTIWQDAFYRCGELTDIYIPNSVTTIVSGAFQNCRSLTSIEIPESVTEIGPDAFRNCAKLTSIVIPEKVTKMGTGAFENCPGLEWVAFTGKAPYVSGSTVSSNLFYQTTTTVYYPQNEPSWTEDVRKKLGGNTVTWVPYEIVEDGTCGENMTWILEADGTLIISGDGAMYAYDESNVPWMSRNGAITRIVVNKGVTGICDYAFSGCSNLTEVSLPTMLTSIGKCAFRNCEKLTEIILPEGLKTIGESAFDGCNKLTSLTIPATVTALGSPLAQSSGNLTKIIFTGNMPAVGEDTFRTGNSSLAVYYPGTDTTWEAEKLLNYGFEGGTVKWVPVYSGTCGANLTWNLIEGVLTISGTGAMDWGTALANVPWRAYVDQITSVVIGEGVTDIGNFAFQDCVNLQTVVLPNTITAIQKYAFYKCSNLTAITLPNGITQLGTGAFWGCKALTALDLPDQLRFVGDFAFTSCSGLSSVIIPDGVQTLGEQVFNSCANLKAVYIPKSVTRIDDTDYNIVGAIGNFGFLSAFTNAPAGLAIYCEAVSKPANWMYRWNQRAHDDVVTTFWGVDQFPESLLVSASVETLPNKTNYALGELIDLTGLTLLVQEENGNTFTVEVSDGIHLLSGDTTVFGTVSVTVRYFSLDVQFNISVLDSGTCGESVTWVFDSETGKLTISGEGPMMDYAEQTHAPWWQYRSQVKTVEIEDGVTSIGNYAFNGCAGLTDVVIPDGVTSIGKQAFASCSALKTAVIPASVISLANDALVNCYDLLDVYFGGARDTWKNFDVTFVSSTKVHCGITAPVGHWAVDTKDSSCGEDGYTREKCACGFIRNERVMPATGEHNFAEIVDSKHQVSAATCQVAAVYKKSCSVCGVEGTETFTHGEVDGSNHTGNTHIENAKTATCTEEGYTGDEVCECGATVKTGEVIEKAKHSFNDEQGSLLTAGTCMTEAVYAVKCDNCTAETSEKTVKGEKDPDNHVGGTEIRDNKAETCTDDGYTGDTWCLGCQTKIADGETIGAPGHKYDQENVHEDYLVSAATCQSAAVYHKSCVCGEKGTETFKHGELKDHVYDQQKPEDKYLIQKATCTEQAVYGNHCKCGAVSETKTFRYGKLEDHVFDQQIADFKYLVSEATCEKRAVYVTSCKCGKASVEDTFEYGELGAHSFELQRAENKYLVSEATCTAKAVYMMSCKCGNAGAETFQYGKLKEHVCNQEKVDAKFLKSEATCTTKAIYYMSCVCGGAYDKTKTFKNGELSPHIYESIVTDPTCTEGGYTTHTCSVCGDVQVDSYTDAMGHDMGEWTVVTEPAGGVDGEQRRDCANCDYYETQVIPFVGNILKLEGEDLLSQSVVYINGLPYPVKGEGNNRYVELPSEEDCYMVTYTYHVGDAADVHTQYPTGMKAYKVAGGKITYIPELDNLLQYSGSSIRITGKKGIRMITSLTKDTKAALTGNGLAGYKLLEYGTALCFASEVAGDGDLVLGKSYTRSNYAYKKGVADPVFATSGNLTQYTNVLVGFSLDQCKDDIAMRPYIILEDADGQQVTLYGGTIYRSIGYIAYQNRNVFQPKTASYNYVWEIIHHVYGDKYDADYKG